ncbi:flavin reductase, partial [Kineococcus sp. R8]|uniref:flavin reductase family protein n=1 Tax=Kineococcus siccus TaxID=2696567 RepID=UPI001411B8D9
PTPTAAPLQTVDTADSRAFRDVLGHVPTGVTLVTSGAPGAPAPTAAMVVGTFGSVSMDPPLVCFMPDRRSTTWPRVRESGRFAASVLGSHQQEVCRAFARKEADRFERFGWLHTPSGLHVVAGAVAWVECAVHDVVTAGDHDIVLGRVLGLGVGDETGATPAGAPLVFARGAYSAPVLP